jgi:hypothetical protein
VPKKRLSKSSLLWFIRSRSYVSIPDVRRRFNLDGGDEVSPLICQIGRVYVGLPSDATRVLGDLVREGRVGLEILPGLAARAAIGVYVVPQPRDRFHPADFDDQEEAQFTDVGGGTAAAS